MSRALLLKMDPIKPLRVGGGRVCQRQDAARFVRRLNDGPMALPEDITSIRDIFRLMTRDAAKAFSNPLPCVATR